MIFLPYPSPTRLHVSTPLSPAVLFRNIIDMVDTHIIIVIILVILIILLIMIGKYTGNTHTRTRTRTRTRTHNSWLL